MNILIAASNLKHANGGVCTHILDLCRGLIQRGHKVTLLFDGTDYEKEIANIVGIECSNLPFMQADSSISCFFNCYRKMAKICREKKIDIIHLHGQRLIPFAWLIRMFQHIPFVWTNHIDCIPQAKLLSFMHKIMRFPIISVSSDLKKQLNDDLGIPSNYIRVINNGIRVKNYTPLSEEERAKLMAQYDLSPRDYVIVELARITYVKGQDALVRAVKVVQDAHPELCIKVLLAGSGDVAWLNERVLNYAKQNGVRCKYIGFQNPRDVFGVSNLVVLPSLFEGFPLSCCEALAMSCSLIRTNTPGWSDLKDYCLTCQKGDLQDLIGKLEYAVSHQEELKGKALLGRKACEEIFNVDHMVELTYDYYVEIANR